MKTLKEAIKAAKKEAEKINGFIIDNRALSMILIKVESKYSDEYILKDKIRYKLSAEEKAERDFEDEKREKKAKEISSSLNFLNF